MLSAALVQDINKYLAEGNVAAALAPLEKTKDLRWNELPKLEKATLTALGKHLREGEAPAEPAAWQERSDAKHPHTPAEHLADVAFHPNISVRRFVRKLVQVLKADAAPLAQPLRARLEKYLHETVIPTTATTDRREIARREEQMETLRSAVDLLRRCDLDEFMACFRALVECWSPFHAERERPWHEEREKSEERFEKHREVYLRRQQEFFQERFGHLGMTLAELREIPRLAQEFGEALRNDPELAALNADAQQEQDTTPKTLMDEIYTASSAFYGALESAAGRNAKPSAEGDKVREILWAWLEETLRGDGPAADAGREWFQWRNWPDWLERRVIRERAMPLLAEAVAAGRAGTIAWRGLLYAMENDVYRHIGEHEENYAPLPPSVTPEALRTLKWGDEYLDRSIEDWIERIEDWLKRHGQTVVIDAKQREEARAAGPYAGMYADAAQYRTIAERVEALCGPPVDERTLENAATHQRTEYRSGRIYLWQEEPDWKSQVAALREAALPRLFEKLRALCRLYVAVHKRTAPVPVQLSKEAAATLTEREQQEWLSNKRQQQQSNVGMELRDICDSITLLGGTAVYSELLGALEVKGLEDFQDEKINELLGKMAHSDELDPAMLPFIRDAHARWERNQQRRRKQRIRVENWQRQSFYTIYVHALYKIGTPETVTEARKIVESVDMSRDAWAWHPLPRLARERRDYDMLLPLAQRSASESKELVALWDDFRKANSDRVPEVVRVLLSLIADATEADSAWTPLAMLSKVEKQTDLFAPHTDLLTQCVESTLPNVTRFALTQLEKMPDADCDWTMLCERAAEKLWSDNAGLAQDAAKFLGKVGAKNEEVAPVALAALGDALSLNNIPLLEAILRAMSQICAKQEVELSQAARKRIERLREEQPSRLKRLCERVMRNT
jgi:hypothetical protein